MIGLARRGAGLVGWVAQPSLAVLNAYLLTMLAAAVTSRRSTLEAPAGLTPHLVVLVPAHDEAPVIAATVRALLGQSYPRDRYEIIVVADNCTDATAAVASGAGAEVWERDEPAARGKGRALAWALERLAARDLPPHGVLVVDADCIASEGLVGALGSRLAAGAPAVQARYVVSNADESPAAALRFAAFSLVHDVRMRGKAHLGLSAGLMGTGMGVSWEWLQRVPWASFSITEDTEYHLQLVAAGGRVAFAPEAVVSSPMPSTLGGSEAQQARWEGGKVQAGARVRQLLRSGVEQRDPVLLHAALEVLIPPQSAVLMTNVAAAGLAAMSSGPRLRRLASANLAAQAAYVFGGLAFVRAPRSAYRALVLAPALVLRKLAILARLARGQGPATFVRTERT